MSDDIFGDLMGSEPPAPKPVDGGRYFSQTLKTSNAFELDRGVTVAWLTQAFGLTRSQCVKKLEGCKILRMNGVTKVYDFRDAVAHMVAPKVDLKRYIENLDPKDLPLNLRKEVWSARLAEQRWRKQAGELWASEDVIAVYGELFKLIKTQSRLWANSIDAVEKLTPAQTEALQDLVDSLLDKIHQSVVALESKQKTPAQIAEVDDDVEATEDDE